MCETEEEKEIPPGITLNLEKQWEKLFTIFPPKQETNISIIAEILKRGKKLVL